MSVQINSSDIAALESRYHLAKQALGAVRYAGGYPVYPKEISEFMAYLSGSCWNNRAYDPGRISALVEQIDVAEYIDLCSVLTAVHRGERFCDGHWITQLKGDTVDKVINRARNLNVLHFSRG